LKSTFSRETVKLLVSDFYKDILGRLPDPIGLSEWVEHVIRLGGSPDALATVLESFLCSAEYGNLLMKKFPVFEFSAPNDKKKVAIWGTRDESRLIFLLLTRKSGDIDIDCFIDDNDMKNFCGLPVNKLDGLDSSIDTILIANTFNAFDNMFDQIDFDKEKLRLVTFDIKKFFFILPDPVNGKLDSPQWAPLLGKETVILSEGVAGMRFADFIEELNGVFEGAFEESIQICDIVKNIEELADVSLNGKTVLIAQDAYVDEFSDLLALGVSPEDIFIVKFTGDRTPTVDQFMNDGDILVYTLPKVGTTSFNKSLKHYGLKTIQTHVLNQTPVRGIKQINPTGDSNANSVVFAGNWTLLINATHVKTICKNIYIIDRSW